MNVQSQTYGSSIMVLHVTAYSIHPRYRAPLQTNCLRCCHTQAIIVTISSLTRILEHKWCSDRGVMMIDCIRLLYYRCDFN